MLDIHLERIDDNGERLKKIVDSGSRFVLSVVPVLLMPEHKSFNNIIYPRNYFYPAGVVDVLKANADNPNITWGQQGFVHYCIDCLERKDRRDPWHENRCLYKKPRGDYEQGAFIFAGREIIQDRLGVLPLSYAAPNHQFDDTTVKVASAMGYKYFADKAMLNLPAYIRQGMIILPERKIGKIGEFFYVHYDEMRGQEEGCFDIIRNSPGLDKLDARTEDEVAGSFWLNEKLVLNEALKITGKRARDWMKIFN